MSASGPSRDRSPELEPEPELRRALERLERPRAREEFRARLERQFVAGSFAADEPDERTANASLGRAEAKPRAWTRWGALAGLAAAAAVLAIFWPRASAGGFEVLDSPGVAGVRIDGKDYELADASGRAALAGALRAGSRLSVEQGALRLKLDRRLVMELGPKSSIAWSALPEPGAGEPIRVEAEGHFAVVTGPGFPGSNFVARTPDAEVSIVGTAFAIDTFDAGTCVCCTAGTVSVQPIRGGAQKPPVAPGGSEFVFRDGSEPKQAKAEPTHTAPLEGLAATWR